MSTPPNPRTPATWTPLAIPGLSLVGMAVSGYLTYLHLSGSRFLCEGFAGCDFVADSAYAWLLGIPVAVLGMAAYGVLFILGLLQLRLRGRPLDVVLLATFGLSLAGFLFSVYLTYLEFLVLYALCPWCLVSAATMTAVLGLTTRSVLAHPT